MAKKQNYYYVLVLTNEGAKFVTKVNWSNKTAEWNKLEKPLEMSKETAKDLTMGLQLNFNNAFMVCNGYEISCQPYRYDKGNFVWKWSKENDTDNV